MKCTCGMAFNAGDKRCSKCGRVLTVKGFGLPGSSKPPLMNFYTESVLKSLLHNGTVSKSTIVIKFPEGIEVRVDKALGLQPSSETQPTAETQPIAESPNVSNTNNAQAVPGNASAAPVAEFKPSNTVSAEDQGNNEMSNAVYKYDGGRGDILIVFEDRVSIQHKGLSNVILMGIKGDKTVYYQDITSVQFKKPTLTVGYIQFSIKGGKENLGGVMGAVQDENTIKVSRDADLAEEIVGYINQKIRETRGGNQTVVQQALSPADEIKKYKELLDMGAITQEEFDAKKKQLLGL